MACVPLRPAVSRVSASACACGCAFVSTLVGGTAGCRRSGYLYIRAWGGSQLVPLDAGALDGHRRRVRSVSPVGLVPQRSAAEGCASVRARAHGRGERRSTAPGTACSAYRGGSVRRGGGL